ncbi:carbohydrate ABC transporter permease [Thermococcus paralvinellae]|uniref:ABC-type transport system, permease component n=1 Tax=Thermococcus paralvinellae TaxID=582419 RepID=W0I8C0_9EURY|nr:carbohydrate ABC transporter permease [Thermococcus paralvinellae]AHF80972.1 ABC-type transport system, permease component [Thermococcus paralvinellae]
MKVKLTPVRVLMYMILILLAFGYLLPIWSAITTSTKTGEQVALTTPIQLVLPPYFGAYKIAFENLKRPIINSLIFTTLATIFSTVLGSLAGFTLAKLIRGSVSRKLLILITFGVFLPYQSILIPLVRLISSLGLYNTIPGLVLTHTAYGIPITTLLFTNYYYEIPDELVEAAKVDGASAAGIYTKIILPLSMPAFVVTAIYQFTSIWNDYLFGVVLTRGEEAMPATVMLANLKGSFVANWNVQMAGALMVALPTLIIMIALGKYLIRGYTSGAIKG